MLFLKIEMKICLTDLKENSKNVTESIISNNHYSNHDLIDCYVH